MTALAVTQLTCADPLAVPALARELANRWLVWDAWVGGKRRVDVHPLLLSEAAHADAVRTAEAAWALVARAADRAAADPVEAARYGLHPDVERLAASARRGADLGSVVRVDLLLRADGRFVACEVNADCPGGYNETLALPRLARSAGFRRGHDPTHVAGWLADRLVARSGGVGSPRGLVALVHATAYAEDLQICAILERLVRERGGRTVRVGPTALSAFDDGIGYRGERVSVLYRFYPIEYMAGQRNIDAIAGATERGELASMTSFAWIFAQSKLAMARAFAFEPEAAAEVFPRTETFAEVGRARLLVERPDWVIKRDLSRVGDHVFVGELFGDLEFHALLADVAAVDGSRDAREGGQVWVAQRFVPQATVPTPWGPRLVTLGVYLVDGRFAGYFARVSEASHCSHDALVLPVFVSEAA